MQYMSAREAGERWAISQRRVATLCMENRIAGCTRVGNMWLIPRDLDKPADARRTKKQNIDTKPAKPFIKWAGGKGQLLSEIAKHYPNGLGTSITKYIEPFIGGGAVLFDILSRYTLQEIYINDINADLINLYKMIKKDVNSIISTLEVYQDTYFSLPQEARRADYSAKRDEFNNIRATSAERRLKKAALFIYLNKTCFNGLYRVNKKGLFNVPVGDYKNPCICDKDNLINVARTLKKVKIHCGNYLDIEKFVDNNTFVYIDPPYRPLNTTSSFTSYTEFAFNDKEQIELAQFASRIKAKKAKVLLSNSDPKNIDEHDDFFERIYNDFALRRVYANRMINSKRDARGKISELLISSF